MLRRLLFADNIDKHVEALEQEMLEWVDDVWRDVPEDVLFNPVLRRRAAQQGDDPLREPLANSLQRLEARWPADKLSAMSADMYFNPRRWQLRYPWADRRRTLMVRILETCALERPPADIYARLEARLDLILRDPYDPCEQRPGTAPMVAADMWLPPNLDGCLRLLAALPPTPQNLELAERVVLGKPDYDLSNLPRADERWILEARSYLACAYGLRPNLPVLMQRLFEHGRFGYEEFAESIGHAPFMLYDMSTRRSYLAGGGLFHGQVDPAFGEAVLGYCDTLAWDLAENLSEDNIRLFKAIREIRGSRYLVLAGSIHTSRNLGKLVYKDYRWRQGLDTGVVHLAQASDVEPESEDERRVLIAELKAFRPSTLKYLLPVARHSRGVLLEALGWQTTAPLVELIVRLAHLEEENWYKRDVGNSPDPSVGMLDVPAVRRALEEAGKPLAREVLAAFRQAKVNAEGVATLIEAVGGWNRADVEKRVAKRSQVAVRAYGLLPVERGDDEVLERYLRLKQFAKESKQFGPQRQANERAAAQAGLANLALAAGYADVTRLEWAMEARLGGGAAESGRAWQIGEYHVEVAAADDGAQVVVKRDDRVLKAVPEAVRTAEVYAEIKETAARLRDQAARFRATFEDLMAGGEALSRDDLAYLSRLPVARGLLGRLILAADDAGFGLFDADTMSLRPLDGPARSIDGPVRLAHPYHLFTAGQLAAWQRKVVRQRIVQPFKQAFRELYLLTPAEEETATFSNRFRGHVLDPRIATRLFQARGWQVESGDVALPFKIFPRQGLQAIFVFPDAGHYLAETDLITGDEIYFLPYPETARYWGHRREARVPIGQVPPLVFSEIMRDADLVVSVAQREGEAHLSSEAYARRGELVETLLSDLGLPGVTVEGHFAHVRGRLANYRVHLGSATIHIEPGHYLCIVPERWGLRHEKLFLPFADEGDAKIGEVISKVILLANDDQIKDQSILQQIRAAGQSGEG